MNDIRKFIKILEDKSTSKGTFVGLRLSDESSTKLVEWMEDNDIVDPTPENKLHVTLILDKVREIEWNDTDYDPPLEIDPETYEFALFGDESNILVLKMKSDELLRRHNSAKALHNIKWDHDEYAPHVTLSYSSKSDIGDLLVPDFPIILVAEYSEPFLD